ncbi:unnamed protein product [Closterium sp. NIES-54]
MKVARGVEGGRHRAAADAVLTPAPKRAAAAAAAVVAARGGAAAAFAVVESGTTPLLHPLQLADQSVADKPGHHLHQLQQGSHRPLHQALLQRLHSRRRRSPRHPHRLRPHPNHPSCHSYPEIAKES